MKKERVFTFKADEELAEILDRIPNKSEFIRRAIEMAMENRCPLCNGTGSLTPAQHNHMKHFMAVHSLKRCDECDAVHFVCGKGEEKGLH
ncbi:CopG family transcriptional regulator [Desulfosediminicola ganghwensis]|uniref:CopG family transcriptional regulator n=1 Tax=Desulfosediminicola ganghwensis TaxID=2569540 RepID=UPI0010AC1D24|nr:CopG family transcriptional regulator [Desulfosediminicola ganghwensis]